MKVSLKEGQTITDKIGNTFITKKNSILIESKIKEEFDNNKPHADRHVIEAIENMLDENVDSEYPFKIQIVGESSKTKFLNVSAFDLEMIVEALS